jgi:predicted AAA+ superfamily ATPase
MERKISQFLVEWKNSRYRKPLILQGARQTGKTYSMLAFGREHYDNVVYFNFETNPGLKKTFDESIEPSYLIPVLSRICGQTIVKGRTLIVFDEVQLCERALTSLKYFCEFAPEYHIIVAGSLLGVAVNMKAFSFPVGKADIKTLYPMDIEEFLLAFGEKKLIAQIRGCFETDTPMPAALHEAALSYYRQYLVVGGMPECLALSGIVTRIHRVERPVKPLENNRDIDAFKIYISDVGLLCAKKDIVAEDVLYRSSDLDDFKGGMSENYVCNQLAANGYPCYYWTSERGAEVDFVIQRGGKIVPVEVKSSENTKAKSLNVYIDTYKPNYALKLSAKNFGLEDGKKSVPLYAAFCL